MLKSLMFFLTNVTPINPNTPVDTNNPNTPITPDNPKDPMPERPDPNDTSDYGKFLTEMYNNHYLDLVASKNIKNLLEAGGRIDNLFANNPNHYLHPNEDNYSTYYDMLKDLGK